MKKIGSKKAKRARVGCRAKPKKEELAALLEILTEVLPTP